MAATTAPALTIDTTHDDMIHDAQLDYYSKKLATCSSDRTIKVYEVTGDVQHSEQILMGHDGPVWQVAWAHPKFGVLLASCGYEGRVIIWREAQPNVWQEIHRHNFHESSVNSIDWAPYEYGLSLACGSADGKVSVITHTQEGWVTSSFQDSSLGCNAVSWAPYNSLGSMTENGPVKRIVTGSCDNSVKIWRFVEHQNEWQLETTLGQSGSGHADWVRDVAWAPNTGLPCNTIASCSEDRTVCIWTQTEEGGEWKREVLHTFSAPVWRVSWSVTGNVLAVSAGDHSITLWKENLERKWIQISSMDEAGSLGAPKHS